MLNLLDKRAIINPLNGSWGTGTYEYISSTVSIFLSLYTKLSNLIFDTGVIPDEWLTGVVKPIFKNKGDPSHIRVAADDDLQILCFNILVISLICNI